MATGDLTGNLVLLDKGKGITQAHAAASFADMVAQWGLPGTLQLDNGPEYSWRDMEAGFNELAALTHSMTLYMRGADDLPLIEDDAEDKPSGRDNTIVRAKPHRPASKPIEGIFRVLEQQVLSAFPGYIGGDRMNQLTHQMGKRPEAFSGGPEAFERAFYEGLRYWRTRKRGRTWQGASVNDTRTAFNADNGPRPASVERDTLIFALSEPRQVMVTNSGVQAGNEHYRSPELLPFTGQKVTIRYAKWAPEYVFFMKDESRPVKLPIVEVHGYLDSDGARKQAELSRLFNQELKAMRKDVAKLDVPEEMRRHADAMGDEVMPLKGASIELAPELEGIAEATALPAPAGEKIELGYGQFIDKKTGDVVSTLPSRHAEERRRRKAEAEELLAQILGNKKADEVAASPASAKRTA